MPTKVVLAVCGTRPEAIKMAPLIRLLRTSSEGLAVKVCSTAQHREMLDQVLDFFNIRPDVDLDLMEPDQSLPALASQALVRFSEMLAALSPSYVVVQGDTTTAFMATLAAFFQRTPVGHIEAGLRTNDIYAPFPEEVNRRLIAVMASTHFAPTDSAARALMGEGISLARIHVTGNTVVDALHYATGILECDAPRREHVRQWLRLNVRGADAILGRKSRLILITSHRRESFGDGLRSICLAIRDLSVRYHDDWFVYPAHLNPRVQEAVSSWLVDLPNVHVVPPVDYPTMLFLMTLAYLIMTDSGGIQEEAPSLKVPTLVMRDTTERIESVRLGGSLLVGTDRARIVAEASRLLDDADAHRRMQLNVNPYGDGLASQRILTLIKRELQDGARAVGF